jgi:small subunit ribosomal protein S4
VNGKIVNIPSYLLKPGDVISVRDKSKKLDVVHNSLRKTKDNLYNWLQLDKATLSGTFLQVPEREEVPLTANEQLIVELYSK